MAFTLPQIVKSAERFMADVELAAARFPRAHRYTLGADLRKNAMEVARLAHRAWRDRNLSLDELSAAIDKAPEELQDLLAVAYLTGARQNELRHMRRDQVGRDELVIEESKTGKLRGVEITPTLRFFLNRALARSKAAGSGMLFTSRRGNPWGPWGVQSAMRRLRSGFRFRDLRPKAASDSPENVLGHAQAMLSRYKRRTRLKPVK